STVSATADGCNGPITAIHKITITPTVGAPVFILGVSSSRCQGTGTQRYSATATNSTSISYSLDASSLTAGNSIDGITGDVTFINTWSGISTVTAKAFGYTVPSTSTHAITVN